MHPNALIVILSLLTASAFGADLPAALKNAVPNTFVKVAGSGPGPRSSFSLVYVPSERFFICVGGSMMMDPEMDKSAVNSPYSEMTLNLDQGRWENRFPKGKDAWGEPAGPSKAPRFPGSYYNFKMKDAEGNIRPYLGAGYYNAMWNWNNCAYDTGRGRIVLHWTLAHEMAEYDPVARTWEQTPTAPGTTQQFHDGMLFGAMCYEPVNREILGGQGGWIHKDGKWARLELGSALINALREKAEALRIRARNLAGAARARYHVAETDEESKVKLDETAQALAKDLTALADQVKDAAAKAQAREKNPLDWAALALASAQTDLEKARALVGAKITVEAILAADAVRDAMRLAVLALAARPPNRAHAPMVYDAANKKIVLFGGDALDRFLADTWVYDPASRTWEQRRPKVSPSPRRSCKLAYLPKCGKVLLMDGDGCKTGETWVYDTKENSWSLLAEGGPARPSSGGRFPVPAAASDDDLIVTVLPDDKGNLATYAAKIDATRVDPDGAAKRGVPPLTETLYGGFWEVPQWYDKNAPPPDPAAEEESLRKLTPNTWTMRAAPNWPKVEYGRSKCWGSCTLDTDRDQLLHFGGGHATYDGNEVLHYSIRANRYYIGHRPEHTLNFAPNGIGIPACTSYQGRPFMSCHTYHAYAYDPTLKRLVFCGTKTEGKGFTYDPPAGDWELDLSMPFHQNGFGLNKWQTKAAWTPAGVVAWTSTGEGLWRVDAAHMTWEKLPLKGKVGSAGWDLEGLAYDSKRERVLLFSSGFKGDITACDAKSGEVRQLAPAGKDDASAACREAVYMPELDAVLIGARPAKSPDGKPRWLVYDCEKNAWLGVNLGGADPLGREQFNVSLGLMYDPRRKLVWAMDILSRPYVLRLDLKTADVAPLGRAPEPGPEKK